MQTENMTYKEISDRLGTQVDSVRKLVRRRRWQKIKGNDGEVRVLVPVEYLLSQSGAQEASQSDNREPAQEPAQPYVRELQLRVEHLQALLDVEKKRASAAELDRDRWHELAIRPWWRRLAG